jgi:hypothetical protein
LFFRYVLLAQFSVRKSHLQIGAGVRALKERKQQFEVRPRGAVVVNQLAPRNEVVDSRHADPVEPAKECQHVTLVANVLKWLANSPRPSGRWNEDFAGH